MSNEVKPARWVALDAFRAVAVLLMIQGHTFTALLRSDAYHGSWSTWHSLVHGLTAPMFLLGGGLAYGIVTGRATRPIGWRLARRALMLLAIGFILQLPRAPLHRIVADRALLTAAMRVGPLQLIGVCLLICEALRVLLETPRRRAAVSGGLAFAISFTAPWVWQWHASEHGPLPLGTWLDGYSSSLFPFFPWAAFFFLGVTLAALVPRLNAARLIAIGAGAAALAYALFVRGHVLRELYGEHELWHTSPLYVAFRSGASLAWLGSLWMFESALRRAWPRLPWLDALARGSLVAYVAHLLVLYGSPFTTGLIHVGKTLDRVEAGMLSFLLCVLTTLIVVAWQRYASLDSVFRVLFGRRRREIKRIAEGEGLDARSAE
jgi:uncharacterized membrane protein